MPSSASKQVKRRNGTVTQDLISRYNTPLELASFYNNGATRKEKALIQRFLRRSPDRYQKEVAYYISNPIESIKKPSRLEEGVK